MLSELVEMVWSNLGTLVPLAGFAGVLVAVVAVIRVSGSDEEAVASWRYRDPAGEGLTDAAGPSTADALAGRWMARHLLALAVALPFLILIAG